MKFEIYKEGKKEVNKPLKLALKENAVGDIQVCVVDDYGAVVNGGHIISFVNDGSIFRYPSLSDEFGLNIDKDGRICIRNL